MTRPAEHSRKLLLTSNDGTQSGRSGYDVIAEYLDAPDVTILRYPRRDPKGFLQKIVRRYHARKSASSWYLNSSRKLEQLALQEIHKGNVGLVHFLWTDRDWGYLDRVTVKNGIRLVCSVHACPGGFDKIYRFPERLSAVDAFILMSSHQRDWFIRKGVPESRLHVVHHGIDTKHFRPLETPSRKKDSDSFTILSVGHTRRNFPVLRQLIESMQEVRNCRFRIISKPAFKHLFAGFSNVQYESNLSNTELLEAYQDADVSILTAEDSTANNALLESLACGLPVVAEAVGGIPEYGAGNDGLRLATPNDVEGLKTSILELARSRPLRDHCAKEARCRAMDLQWDFSVERIKQLYESY